MKRVVHFEIGCNDLEKTSTFYKTVFDWNLKQQGSSAVIDTGVKDSIPGHINKLGPNEPQQYVTIYIETDSLELDLEKVQSNGGKVLVKPIKLPDGRVFAWFEDVAGNTIGLITSLDHK
jgi:predicted enzyme related to lactoylglutathione lyase